MCYDPVLSETETCLVVHWSDLKNNSMSDEHHSVKMNKNLKSSRKSNTIRRLYCILYIT